MEQKNKKKAPVDENIPAEQETQEVLAEEECENPFERELAETKDKYLRLAAEYDNFRKRTQREREGLYTDCKADTILQFLPVIDNLERAVKTETQDTAYAQGVEMIMRQMKDILSKLGVSEIQNDVFDPKLHDCVMHVEDESLGEGQIVEVFEKGYQTGDKVLRHSVVKSAN